MVHVSSPVLAVQGDSCCRGANDCISNQIRQSAVRWMKSREAGDKKMRRKFKICMYVCLFELHIIFPVACENV